MRCGAATCRMVQDVIKLGVRVAGAIGRPALAATTMPPPRVCADVGPVIDAAVP